MRFALCVIGRILATVFVLGAMCLLVIASAFTVLHEGLRGGPLKNTD